MPQGKNTHRRPVIFGEVLFDCFPDGRNILGGAPFNVAWHLQGFGLMPLMLTGVGEDPMGQQVKQAMREWGMDVSGVQTNSRFPTGRVSVKLDSGQPSYEILPDQAYDHLETGHLMQMLADDTVPLIYHGSLALRTEQGRKVFDTLSTKLGSPIFLDLNLRDPWWEHNRLDEFLHRATWVKLNDQELLEISGTHDNRKEVIKAVARDILDRYHLRWLIVTLGEDGAFVVTQNNLIEGNAVKVQKIMDTVGAGDAFSAVAISGILRGWPIDKLLKKALAFAAEICAQRGATSRNLQLYQ